MTTERKDSTSKNKAFNDKRIVIASMNNLFLKDASREFKKRGFRDVVYARTGDSAWEIISARKIDVLICDWEIPGMHCRQLMEKMAWSHDTYKIDTVITVQSMNKTAVTAIAETGPAAILVKPFSLETLATRVEQLVKQRALDSTSPETLPTRVEQLVKQRALDDVNPETLPTPGPKAPDAIEEVISLAIGKNRRAISVFHTEATTVYFDCFQRFFSTQRLTSPIALVNAATDEFGALLKTKVTTQCEAWLDRIADEAASDVLLFRKKMAEFTSRTHDLLETLSVEFYVHLQDRLMESIIETAPLLATAEKTAWIVDAFRISLANRTNMLNDALLDTLNESMRQLQDVAGEDALVLHELVDAFGRGLMEPLNERFKIMDCADCTPPLRNVFPRQLCGPVLAVLKEFIIGPQKYDRANQNILKSIRFYMGREAGFELDKLRLFFMHPRIRQSYVDTLLHCLTALSSEVRRENFIKKINKHAEKIAGGQTIAFDNRAWVMLSRSWANAVKKDSGKNQKDDEATNAVLEEYLNHSNSRT